MTEPEPSTGASFGGLRYSSARDVLERVDGSPVALRAQSLAVFRHLAARPDTVVPKQALFDAVWGDAQVTDDSLVQCIADIRRALGDDARHVLKTLPRRGYMLVADATSSPASMPTSAATASGDESVREDGARGRVRFPRIHGGPAVLATVLLVLVGAYAWSGREAPPPDVGAIERTERPASAVGVVETPATGAPADDRIALAVTTTDDPVEAPLADVLVETRLALSRYRTVRLVPPERAEQVLELALGVTGSAERRLLVELSDAGSGELLHGDTHTVGDGDDIARELGVRVAAIASPGGGAIMRRLLADAAGKPAEALSRRECFALGFECTTCSGELSTVTPRAVACLADILEEDPDDARAWALHGVVLVNQYWWGSTLAEPARSTLAARTGLPARAIEAGNRAEALSDGADGAVHWSLALGHAAACEADALQSTVDRGLRVNPDDPNMLGAMGNWLAYNGRWEEGVRLATRAIEMQPAHHKRFWHYAIAKDHYRRGEWQAAHDAFMRAHDERNWLNHLQLAYTLPWLGRIEEARREIDEVQRLYPGFTIEKAIEFYRMFCFDDAYLDTIETALTRAGLPSRGDASDRANIELPHAKVLRANGVDVEYVDIGAGEPIVFVHGSNSDYRAWAHFELPVSERHRYIAYSRRYYGSQAWPDDGESFSLDTDANDLIAFVEALDTGPVHLVGWSSGAVVAPLAALRRPDLVRSLVLYEPSNTESLPEGEPFDALREAYGAMWAPVVRTLQEGDVEAAAKRFLEAAFSLREGEFETESMGLRQIILDNARVLPVHLGSPPDAAARLDCDALVDLAPPTLVITGERTTPTWRATGERFAECAPGATLAHVAGVNHDGPVRRPDAILALLLEFVDGLSP